jgi:hypothetical protein
MATPFDMRLDALPEAERQEIETILRAKGPGWVSDAGDGMLIWAILAVGSLFGIIATLVEFGVEQILAYFRYAAQELPYSFSSSMAGFCVACVVLPICIWKFVTLYGRFGWMATSFGVLRVRGRALRLVRWGDITRVSRRRIGGRNPFSVVTFGTKQGHVFESTTGGLMTEIKQRVPPGTPIVE